jgi:uncharacterized protein YgiB involved in biofilm formation
VTLVLAGAAALAGCNRDASGGKRYASQAECVADWGSPEDCKQEASSGGGHGGHSWIYYGAASSLLRGNTAGVRSGSGVHDTSSSSTGRAVSRGGFGSTGRSGVSS